MTSLNPQARALALAQGPINTAAWPLPAFSGQTGGSLSYGWRHDHALLPQNVGAWVQCYAARPAYYEGEPSRHGDYYIGCRPTGWKNTAYSDDTDLWTDLDSGAALYHDGTVSVSVSGLDFEHPPLSPLLAVADSTGHAIPTPNGVAFAQDVARPMLRYLAKAHAGMLRKPDGKLISYTVVSRPASYILRTLVQCGKRGLLDAQDRDTMLAYVETVLLPSWENPYLPQPEKGGMNQLYNGCPGWLAPALYDLVVEFQPGHLRQRLYAALVTMCKKAMLVEALCPGHGTAVTHVTGWDGLTAAGCTVEPDFGLWGIRAWCVAAEVMGAPGMRKVALAEAAKWPDTAANRTWKVGADGTYL